MTICRASAGSPSATLAFVVGSRTSTMAPYMLASVSSVSVAHIDDSVDPVSGHAQGDSTDTHTVGLPR